MQKARLEEEERERQQKEEEERQRKEQEEAAAKAARKAERRKERELQKEKEKEKEEKEKEKEKEVVEEEVAAEAEGSSGGGIHAGKKNLNIVFIGHVDAGKSTICGHLLYLTGMVDQRTIEKYEREAKAKNRESWVYAWCIDTNEEERDRGKTHEMGLAQFFTDKKRITILDAPGHRDFVGEMIGGASQADVGILVISARRGEFETGFDNGGQTREHAMLAKTAGVRKLVVVINKMDEPSVGWSVERYNECVNGLKPFLRQVGFSGDDIFFMPVSGMTGANLLEPFTAETSPCPWYEGPSLIGWLDNVQPPIRDVEKPVRVVIFDKTKDMGFTVVNGKVEYGTFKTGDRLILMPNRVSCEVVGLFVDSVEYTVAEPGDNFRIRLKGVEPEDIRSGFMLCDPSDLCTASSLFDARLMILDYKSIISAGFSAVMHSHAIVEEVTITKLHALVNKRNEITQKLPRFTKTGDNVMVRLQSSVPLCVETFKKFDHLGRFVLRDEGLTIAVGIITKLH